MTPPCMNCHGAPYTTPWPAERSYGECRPPSDPAGESWDCLTTLLHREVETNPQSLGRLEPFLDDVPQLFQNFVIELPSPLLTEPPECSAEERWPEALRQPRTQGQALPWWVRGNYERLRGDPSPVRIDLREAEVTATVRIRPDAVLPLVDGILYLTAGSDGGEIEGELRVRDGEIQLLRASLLRFTGLQAEVRPATPLAPSVLDVTLEEVTTGDFGGLHLVGWADTSAMFFVQPFMVPIPRPGYDSPTIQQWMEISAWPGLEERCNDWDFIEEHVGVCPQPAVLPDRSQDTSALDLNALAFLPERLRCQIDPLLDAYGRLPQFLHLEDLISFLLNPEDEDCPPAGESQWTREQLAAFFESTQVTVRLGNLRDLFVPGVIDLGPGELTAQIEHSMNSGLSVAIPNFSLRLDPMGYPADSEHPSVRILGGVIEPGVGPSPGIVLQMHPRADGAIELAANLRVSLQLSVPLLGEVEVHSQVRVVMGLVRTPSGLRPAPGSISIHLQDLSIYREGSPHPWLEEGEILLTDRPQDLMSIPGAFADSQTETQPRVGLRIDGIFSGGLRRHLEASARVRIDENGLYVVPSLEGLVPFLGSFPVQDLDFEVHDLPAERRVETRIRGHFQASEDMVFTATFDADRVPLRSREGQPGDLPPPIPMIRNGTFHFSYRELEGETPGHEQGELQIAMDLFRLATSFGLISLRNVEAQVDGERLRNSDLFSTIQISRLRVDANQEQRGAGLVRGPVRIEQRGRSGLEFLWDRSSGSHRVNMQGLDLRFSAPGIYPPARMLARIPGSSEQGQALRVGVDGRLLGHFSFDFGAGRGRGHLILRGDPQGDVVVYGPDGTRLGALISDTRWNLYSIRRYDPVHEVIYGNFNLDTIFDWRLARHFGFYINMREHFRMIHHDIPFPPWSARGYQYIEAQFLTRVARDQQRRWREREAGGEHEPTP